jgi:hypothetical protein
VPGDTFEFDRGQEAGKIAARMAGYDHHFDLINGSIADSAKALNGLTLIIQSLRDSMEADRNTAKALALALKEAEDARRRKQEESWSPRARLYTFLASLATIITALAVVYATFHH